MADQGNFVIRRLTLAGEVQTLAGSPGQCGSLDGTGAQARFTELWGLALYGEAGEPDQLYAVDGHALRRISLPDGTVTTLVGVVETPGFQDVQHGPRTDRVAALRQPCLNRPCGLLSCSGGLGIVDQGNHSLRLWGVGRACLSTAVGDPSLGQTRWGLLRDRLEGPLDERYAALESPRTMVFDAQDPGTVVVATGNGLAELYVESKPGDQLGALALTCGPASLAEACVLTFSAAILDQEAQPSLQPLHYSVVFLEPDGKVALQVRGTGTDSAPITVQGQFSQRGTGTVIVRYVTEQGVSKGAVQKVEVH